MADAASDGIPVEERLVPVAKLPVTEDVMGLSVSPDGDLVALGLWDGNCVICHLPSVTLAAQHTRDAPAHHAEEEEPGIQQVTIRLGAAGDKTYIGGVAFAPDSRRLILSGAGGNIQIWEVEVPSEQDGSTLRAKMCFSLTTQGSFVRAATADLVSTTTDSSDDRLTRFYTGSGEGVVAVWNAFTGELIDRLDPPTTGEVNDMAVSRCSTYLSTAADTGLRLWIVGGEDNKYSLVPSPNPGGCCWAAQFSLDSTTIFCSRQGLDEFSVPNLSHLRHFSALKFPRHLSLNDSGTLLSVVVSGGFAEPASLAIVEVGSECVIRRSRDVTAAKCAFVSENRVCVGGKGGKFAPLLDLNPSFTKSARFKR
jgi:WD domain, G-beta repeat